jgi:hypothetical protein
MGLSGTLLFHLNLSYSAIEKRDRAEVVRRCYRPILEISEELPWCPVAVEATAHTLERIAEIDPDWLERLRAGVEAGRVEFIGSGDTQLIGPLVPAVVNRWNQELGRAAYERLLGRAPRTALVNEMAWSQGIIDAYLDAGYDLLLMEWNNPRRRHPEWRNEWRYRASWSESPRGRRIAVGWVDAVAFQKFQRTVVEEMEIDEYVAWVLEHADESARHLCLYASDAEVFDFRPGRFEVEAPLGVPGGLGESGGLGEWGRIRRMLEALHEAGVRFTTPAVLREDPDLRPRRTLCLRSASDPIPVKKQPKYNVTRWALSGWDDVGLNTRCHAHAARLEREGAGADRWRRLCRDWASDFRTHLTEGRWIEHRLQLESREAAEVPAVALETRPPLSTARVERRGKFLDIETDDVRVSLNLRRGLAIESLSFPSVLDRGLLGTLPHGHFDDIDWAADFYSGHTVLEMPAMRRVTDLARVEPVLEREDDRIIVSAEIPTPLGGLPERVTVLADRIELSYAFSRLGKRPLCSLRTAILTLLPGVFGEDLAITTASGGDRETFLVQEECDHGGSVSSLVSANAAFGATDGSLLIDDGQVGFELMWDPGEAAALPLFTFRRIGGQRFVRIAFSLSEVDETHRPGAPLLDFRLAIRAKRSDR